MSINGHWYTRDGKPCHTQPTKTGAANKERATHIGDARKLGLLPSVSGVTKMMSSGGLEAHKMREVAKACYNSPAHPGEELDTYIREMIEESGKDVSSAAELGTKIHKAIEDQCEMGSYEDEEIVLTTGVQCLLSDLVNPAIDKFNKLDIEIDFTEKVLVNNAEGYAGTTDIIWRSDSALGVLDWKSKRTKACEKIKPIDSHPMQIAAYIAAQFGPHFEPHQDALIGYNVYVSTTEPGRVEVVQYGPKELKSAWESFLSCCQLWRYTNQYDPRQTKEEVYPQD
jgi:hypothetical protein